jgi:hypothetical protein
MRHCHCHSIPMSFDGARSPMDRYKRQHESAADSSSRTISLRTLHSSSLCPPSQTATEHTLFPNTPPTHQHTNATNDHGILQRQHANNLNQNPHQLRDNLPPQRLLDGVNTQRCRRRPEQEERPIFLRTELVQGKVQAVERSSVQRIGQERGS